MASTQEPCCGHDHVGGEELWLTVDELVDLVADTVRALFGISPRELTDADRAAIRARYEERERVAAEHVAKARPGGWRTRVWG